MSLERLSRWVAWTIAAVILYATLSPLQDRPLNTSTSVGADVQRFLAFMALGATFSVGYPRRRVAVALGVAFIATTLEAVQILTPDRHARVADGLVKVMAALSGCAIAFAAGRSRRRPR